MRLIARYVLAYGLWAVTCAAGFFVAFIVRNTYLLTFAMLTRDSALQSASGQFYQRLQGNAVERIGIVSLALALLVLVVVSESLYRTGVPLGQLGRRFFLLTTIELGILFVSHVLYFAQAVSVGLLPVSSGYVQLVELALLVLCAWLYARQPQPADGH
jgi:hypothetical protein